MSHFRVQGWTCFSIALAGLCGAVACGGAADSSRPSGASPPDAAVTVSTASATASDVAVTLDATGSFVADENSDVAAQTASVVIETPVNIGMIVAQSQVLVRLDDREALLRLDQARAAEQQAESEVEGSRATLASAQSQAKLAKSNADRYGDLLKTGDVSQTAYEQAAQQATAADDQARTARQRVESGGAAIASARAQAALAKKAADDCVIRAPFSGYISDRPAAIGEYATPGFIVARILRTQPIQLQTLVPEIHQGRLRPGQLVSARVGAYPDREFVGTLRGLSPAIDATSRTISTQTIFANADNVLRPGMFATVRITEEAAERAVFVPRAAVPEGDQSNTQVFVISDNVAHARQVRLGDPQGALVRILSGVAAGEVVATSNLANLHDAARVQLAQ